jgi:hypothetical protein
MPRFAFAPEVFRLIGNFPAIFLFHFMPGFDKKFRRNAPHSALRAPLVILHDDSMWKTGAN